MKKQLRNSCSLSLHTRSAEGRASVYLAEGSITYAIVSKFAIYLISFVSYLNERLNKNKRRSLCLLKN